MSEALTIDAVVESGEEAAELQAAIRQTFERMDELDVLIAHDQADIDRLKTENRSMLAQLNIFSSQNL